MCMTIECPECGHGIRITRIEVARRHGYQPQATEDEGLRPPSGGSDIVHRHRPAAADWLGLETKVITTYAPDFKYTAELKRADSKPERTIGDPAIECAEGGCDEDCNCRG